METTCKLHAFLKAASGNWRNALFIRCDAGPCAACPGCRGFLLAAGSDGTPILVPVEKFCRLTGEPVEEAECAAVLDKRAFESAYSLWLVWNVENPKTCPCLQMTASF